jgi:hypothetical protein
MAHIRRTRAIVRDRFSLGLFRAAPQTLSKRHQTLRKYSHAITWGILIGILFMCATGCAPAPLGPSLAQPTAESPMLVLTRALTERAQTNTREARPTETEKPVTPIRAGPTPTIEFAKHFEHAWNRIPEIVMVTKKDDPRISEVHQAMQFWNDQLKSILIPMPWYPQNIAHKIRQVILDRAVVTYLKSSRTYMPISSSH